MARITVEDCLARVNNRFAIIHLAAKRVRQLRKGAEPLVAAKNRDIVVALREIAAGKVYPMDKEGLAAAAILPEQISAGEPPQQDEHPENSGETPHETVSEEAVPEGN